MCKESIGMCKENLKEKPHDTRIEHKSKALTSANRVSAIDLYVIHIVLHYIYTILYYTMQCALQGQ